MLKQINKYDSPIDALVSAAKRLSIFEDKYRMTTEDFFNKFNKGQMEDSIDYIEWSNNYRHYLAIRSELEKQLRHVA